MIKPSFTTLEQCKEILGITVSDYDTLLPTYIKQVNSFLLDPYGWLNNEYLVDQDCTVENISEFIVESTTGIGQENTFVVDGEGNTLYIIDEIDFDESRLYTDFNTEGLTTATLRIRILPLGAKTIACQMALYMTLKANGSKFGIQQLKSEKIGTYSYNLSDNAVVGDGGYPQEYLDALKNYKTYEFHGIGYETEESSS